MNRQVVTATGLSFGSMFFLGVGMSVIGAAARNIGLDTYQIGILQAVQYLGFAVAVTVFGSLSELVSKTGLMSIGTGMTAVSFFFLYRYPSFALNTVFMFGIGSGMGAFEGVTDALLMDAYPNRPGKMIAANHLFVTIGALAITSYLIVLQVNWRSSIVQASAVLVLFSAGFLFLRLPVSVRPTSTLKNRLAVLRRERTLVVLTAAMTAGLGIQIATAGTLTTFLMTYRGFNQVNSKIALLLFSAGIATGRIVIGAFVKPRAYYRALLALFGFTTILNALIFAVDFGPAIYIVLVIAGFVVSGVLPLIITFAGLAYRESAGSAMGIVKLGISGGGILVPFLVSILTRNVSSHLTFALFSVISLLAFILLLTSRFRKTIC